MSDAGAKLIADAINGVTQSLETIGAVYLTVQFFRWWFGGNKS